MGETVSDKLKKHGLDRWFSIVEPETPTFENKTENADEIRLAVAGLNKNFEGKKKIQIRTPIEFSNTSNTGWDYSYCEFFGPVKFHKCDLTQDMYFKECVFHEVADFSESTFNNNTRFHGVEFKKEAVFTNTTFKSLIDFYFSTFCAPTQFHLTDFEGTTIFSNVTFCNTIQFLHNKVKSESYISFENAKFHKGIDLSRSNFWCTKQFWGVLFLNDKKKRGVSHATLKNQPLYLNDNNINDNEDAVIALQKLRETFRIIKYEFRNQGNHIAAQEFHRYEIHSYKEELYTNKSDKKRSEKLLLRLNWISNDHGGSWSRALLFTLGVNLLVYLIYLGSISNEIVISWGWTEIGNWFKYFFQLLNVTKWEYEPFKVSNEPEGYIILFLGRLFIGYGYYQFIQAFRKYGKN